ncbi:MAG: phospholipid/cholesterol/gamma-HCH transport system substrate-binding protein [Verrucomicrobiota bacterium]|jgi:ABC-type transporter Mla subunit MlaD
MNEQDRAVELKVGAFVFLGLAVLGALVVQFGRVGEGFKHYYPLTIEFPDASGLLKGSDVLLAGAKIGRVSEGPHLVRGHTGVAVPLRIYDFVKIPLGSKFTVGSSGLLGDRFVSVTLPKGEPSAYVAQNTTLQGARETGLDDLTREGDLLVRDLRGAVQKIDATATRLHDEALSPENMQNLKASIEHLNNATGALAESSKKFDGILDKTDATMSSAKQAAEEAKAAIADARQVIQSATEGKGLMATLLTNQELGNDLRALIKNLRAHGVLFYRDTGAKIDINARDQNAPHRSGGGR